MKPAVVLDLTGLSSVYATRLLAEAGHRVIRLESAEGDAVRREAPFAGGRFDLERGVFHLFMNAGKESLALERGTDTAALLLALTRIADVAVVPRPLPVPAERLFAANPRLALVEVDEVPNELTAYARSGLLSLTGQPNEQPVVIGGHAALAAIGLYTGVAATSALYAARTSGSPQRVEVSGINCLEALVEQAALTYHATGRITKRRGYRGEITALSGAFPCADGYWMISLGQNASWKRFLEWMDDPELKANAALADEDERQKHRDELLDRVSAWSRTKKKAELVTEAQARHLPASPVSTTDDLKDDPQLLARGFLREIDHPLLGHIRFPSGAIACVGGTTLRAAPRLGEHTAAILAELGLSPVSG